ncbi:hypothetical protein FQZ97_761150 [compost metagenome]
MQARRVRGVAGDQRPGVFEAAGTVGRQPKRGLQHGGVVVVGGEHGAQTFGHHGGSAHSVALVAAAAHHIGRTKHHVVAQGARHTGGFAVLGELRDAAGQALVPVSDVGGRVVVRGLRHARGHRRCRQALDGRRHLAGARCHTVGQLPQCIGTQAGALQHRHGLQRLVQLFHDVGRVVVEGQQRHPALRQPAQGVGLAVEVEGLLAQMQARVAGQMRLRRLQRLHQRHQAVAAAQAGLPRMGHAMEGGGNAVGHELPVGVGQGHAHVEVHAGTGHELALEGVAMQIDHARQHQTPTGFQHRVTPRAIGDVRDHTVLDQHDSVVFPPGGQQGPATHDRPASSVQHAFSCLDNSKTEW